MTLTRFFWKRDSLQTLCSIIGLFKKISPNFLFSNIFLEEAEVNKFLLSYGKDFFKKKKNTLLSIIYGKGWREKEIQKTVYNLLSFYKVHFDLGVGGILGMDSLQVPWFAFEMLNNQGTQKRKHVELCFLGSNDKTFLELICLKWKDLVGRFFDTKNNKSKQKKNNRKLAETFWILKLFNGWSIPHSLVQYSLGFWCIIT